MHSDTPKMLTCATAVALKTFGSGDSGGADTQEDITIAGGAVRSLSERPDRSLSSAP